MDGDLHSAVVRFRVEREAVRDARLAAVITFGCGCIIAACICGIMNTVLTLGAYLTGFAMLWALLESWHRRRVRWRTGTLTITFRDTRYRGKV